MQFMVRGLRPQRRYQRLKGGKGVSPAKRLRHLAADQIHGTTPEKTFLHLGQAVDPTPPGRRGRFQARRRVGRRPQQHLGRLGTGVDRDRNHSEGIFL
jgi:hypothetical protein